MKAFDEHDDEGIFLGYSTTRKSFIILNKITMVVEESINVVFDEPHIDFSQKEVVSCRNDKQPPFKQLGQLQRVTHKRKFS